MATSNHEEQKATQRRGMTDVPRSLHLDVEHFSRQRSLRAPQDFSAVIPYGPDAVLLIITRAHGGDRCARFVIRHFPEEFRRHRRRWRSVAASLRHACQWVSDAWDRECYPDKLPVNQHELTQAHAARMIDTSGASLGAVFLMRQRAVMLTIGKVQVRWRLNKMTRMSAVSTATDVNPRLSTFAVDITRQQRHQPLRLNGQLDMAACLGTNTARLYGRVSRVPTIHRCAFQYKSIILMLCSNLTEIPLLQTFQNGESPRGRSLSGSVTYLRYAREGRPRRKWWRQWCAARIRAR